MTIADNFLLAPLAYSIYYHTVIICKDFFEPCKEEIEMSAFAGNENVRFGHFG